MVDYVKSTNFYAKDALVSGDPNKIIKGAEIDVEFNNISTSVTSKADLNSPTFSGSPTAPTAALNTNTTQLATTAFVKNATDGLATGGTLTNATLNNATIASLAVDLKVEDGGTGKSSLALNHVLLGNGTAAIQEVAPGSSGNVLKSNGSTWVSGTVTSGLGDGQTWQNVSRTGGTTYTNTTGRPICAMVNIYMFLSGSGTCSVVVSGVTILSMSYSTTAGGGGQSSPFSFIIPAGATYSVSTTGSMNVNYWTELR